MELPPPGPSQEPHQVATLSETHAATSAASHGSAYFFFCVHLVASGGAVVVVLFLLAAIRWVKLILRCSSTTTIIIGSCTFSVQGTFAWFAWHWWMEPISSPFAFQSTLESAEDLRTLLLAQVILVLTSIAAPLFLNGLALLDLVARNDARVDWTFIRKRRQQSPRCVIALILLLATCN